MSPIEKVGFVHVASVIHNFCSPNAMGNVMDDDLRV